MGRFLARRLAATLPVLLVVAVLVFLMLRLTPGDPAAVLAGDAASTENAISERSSAPPKRQAASTPSGTAIRTAIEIVSTASDTVGSMRWPISSVTGIL